MKSGLTLGRSADSHRPSWLGESVYTFTARLWVDGDNPSLINAHGGLFEIAKNGLWFFQANPDFTGKSAFEARWEDLRLAKHTKPRTVMPWQNAKGSFTLRGIGAVPRLVFRTSNRTVLVSFHNLDWLIAGPIVKDLKAGVYEI